MIAFPCCYKSRPLLQKEARTVWACPSKTRTNTRPKTDLNVSAVCQPLLWPQSTWLKQWTSAGTSAAFAAVLHVPGGGALLAGCEQPRWLLCLSLHFEICGSAPRTSQKRMVACRFTLSFSLRCQQWCSFLLHLNGSLHMSEFPNSLWQHVQFAKANFLWLRNSWPRVLSRLR